MILAIWGPSNTPAVVPIKPDKAMIHTISPVTFGNAVWKPNPIRKPLTSSAPINSAPATPPGMPRPMIGMMCPASLASDEPSGAMMPSGIPVPNSARLAFELV